MTLFMQKKLQNIMNLVSSERETALREYAKELGCSLSSSYTNNGKHIEQEIVTRIHESMRSIRESRLWWIALISALASAFSAFAAWYAAFKNSISFL